MALTAAVRRSIDCYIELHCFLETVGALEHFDWIFAEISGGDRDSLLSVECSSTLVEGGEAGDFLNIRIASQRRVSKVTRSSWRPRSKRLSSAQRRSAAWRREVERWTQYD